MTKAWRTDGIDTSKLEVWAIGYPGTGSDAAGFGANSQSSCFAEDAGITDGVWQAFTAKKDDIFVIDQSGLIVHVLPLPTAPLSTQANRDQLDQWVRALVGN